jgi:hypothetical protein
LLNFNLRVWRVLICEHYLLIYVFLYGSIMSDPWGFLPNPLTTRWVCDCLEQKMSYFENKRRFSYWHYVHIKKFADKKCCFLSNIV